jgi:ribosomal protein S24E
VGDFGVLGKRLGDELQIGGTVEDCDHYSAVSTRLDGVHDAGFVRMQCGWDLKLVFTRKTGQGWFYLQTLTVPNKYEEAQTIVASVTGDDSQQLVVHKAQSESGTGISQQDFLIYKLIEGRLRSVLNVVEAGHLTSPWTDHEVSQESRFKFIPPDHDAAKGINTAATFDETQILEFAGMRVELKRQHIWSAADQVFMTSQWYSARPLKSATPKSK